MHRLNSLIVVRGRWASMAAHRHETGRWRG